MIFLNPTLTLRTVIVMFGICAIFGHASAADSKNEDDWDKPGVAAKVGCIISKKTNQLPTDLLPDLERFSLGCSLPLDQIVGDWHCWETIHVN